MLTYCAIVLGFVFIPGPATLLTVARASASGTKVGLATGIGISVGDIIHTAFAVVGISAIIAASATLFAIIKFIGAGYLFYLGINAILAKDAMVVGGDEPQLTAFHAFQQGVLTEVLNPKTALFFLAFLPQFVRPENGAFFLQLSILGIVFSLLGLFSTIVFAISADRLGMLLRRHPAISKWQSKVVGGIYCALGVRLALQQR